MRCIKGKPLAVLVACLSFALPCSSQTRQCKANPKIVAACYVVHGRATNGPGTPALRIWPVGTKRMFGVTAGPVADDADDPICPANMLRFSSGSERIFGDFEICPFTTERRGAMQMVCVESAKHLVVTQAESNHK
jgi:hypothetical protein